MKEKSAAEAYPLYWPEGWKRTSFRKPAAFKLQKSAFVRVRTSILKQIRLMKGKHVILSTNIPLRNDDLPYAKSREPEDPGVAVYWYDPRTKQQRCMANDRWNRIIHNMRALELSLEAIRSIARWGSTEIVDRAFAGFNTLPPSGEEWLVVFGFSAHLARPTIDDVKQVYRELAMHAHPDHGGSPHEMVRLNTAMEAATRDLG